MGKVKKKNRGVSDKVQKKRQNDSKKQNPFEVKINRQKHSVLGKKITKHETGLPGVSRSKANQKRKNTLLQEYKQRGKANKFVDKRFGEQDPNLSVEEKMLGRFALEKQKSQGKASLFNLNDDEDLTHFGQSLSEVEKFEDPVDLSDDDEDEDRGKLGAKHVEEHFGGFLEKPDETDVKHKTWREKMEEVIAKSKKEKYERQAEREKTLEMTEKLDQDWKLLQSVFIESKLKKTKDDDDEPKKKIDDYDVAVRELALETKGKATDRMKTEEELAKEEKEKLEKLEADRLRRMKGITSSESERTHRSAEDLDDGLYLGPDDVPYQIAYKDGKLLGPPKGILKKSSREDSEEDEDDDDDSLNSGDDDVNIDGGNFENESDSEESDGVEKETPDDSGEDAEFGDANDAADDEDKESADELKTGDSADEEEDDDNDDSFSDIEDENDDDAEHEDIEAEVVSKKSQIDDKKVDYKKEKKVMIAKAKKELPYTFKAPESYEDLIDLLADHNEKDQLIIIERLRKCHHPSLAEGNKEKLENLFNFLLIYAGDIALDDPPQLNLVDNLIQHLYELTQMSPDETAKHVIELVNEKHSLYSEYCERRNGKGIFPGLEMLITFKIISVLFPTSDFRHPVVTKAMILMAQILNKSSVNNLRDVASGLFLSTIFLQYVCLSKRYVPEVMNFIQGVLFLAAEKDPKKVESVVPPFKPVGKNIDLLRLKAKTKEKMVEPIRIGEILGCKDLRKLDNDRVRLSIIKCALELIDRFMWLYEDIPSFTESFKPIRYFLGKLPLDFYHVELKELGTCLQSKLQECSSVKKPLVRLHKKTLALKMLEPKFDEEGFDGRKKRGGSRDFKEKQTLLHKYKKEHKGALREIRKDTQFLARVKLKEQMSLDAERKQKVKRIHSMLANQEGEYKAMKRKKMKF